MEPSNYLSAQEWCRGLRAQGYSVSQHVVPALEQTAGRLGLSFQEAFRFLDRHEKIIRGGFSVVVDLTYLTLLDQATHAA